MSQLQLRAQTTYSSDQPEFKPLKQKEFTPYINTRAGVGLSKSNSANSITKYPLTQH